MAWIGGGILLIAAPAMASEPERHRIIVTLAGVFAFGALGDARTTGGRHFGRIVLSAVVAMVVAGYSPADPAAASSRNRRRFPAPVRTSLV